jgi:maleate cis-trans isomerase
VVAEAFGALNVRSVVVLSPYRSNDDVVGYLDDVGVKVVHQVALGLVGIDYGNVSPAEWLRLAVEHDRKDAEAIFLSCTATTQLESIQAIEKALGKPVINSNQAVIWGCVRRLSVKLGELEPMPRLGRLLSIR